MCKRLVRPAGVCRASPGQRDLHSGPQVPGLQLTCTICSGGYRFSGLAILRPPPRGGGWGERRMCPEQEAPLEALECSTWSHLRRHLKCLLYVRFGPAGLPDSAMDAEVESPPVADGSREASQVPPGVQDLQGVFQAYPKVVEMLKAWYSGNMDGYPEYPVSEQVAYVRMTQQLRKQCRGSLYRTLTQDTFAGHAPDNS